MKCKCVETDHSHQGYCNLEITFEDSIPMNYYKVEKVYSKDSSGERIVIDRKTVDYDKDRCCNDCYDKIKNEAISQFEKHQEKKLKMDKEIKEAFTGCEICGESVKGKKGNDGINVCDFCNDKYQIKE